MNRMPAIAALLALIWPPISWAEAQPIRISAIPYSMSLENPGTASAPGGSDRLDLTSSPKSDLFVSPDGRYSTDKSPRLLFRPVGAFILTARIRPEFRTKWDAGVLLVFNDPTHFAKFCYEQDYRGSPRIVSVVCNDTADDCNSEPVPAGEIFFRVIGSSGSDTFTFYTSPDGKSWFPIRSFRLQKADNVRLGFSSQSPEGPGCTVHFTAIALEARAPRDFWLGD